MLTQRPSLALKRNLDELGVDKIGQEEDFGTELKHLRYGFIASLNRKTLDKQGHQLISNLPNSTLFGNKYP